MNSGRESFFRPEGPIIFIAEEEDKDFKSQNYIHGLLYDPSDITKFTLNEKDVEPIRIETEGRTNTKVSEQIYRFKYLLSLNAREKGVLSYRAEDSLRNISEGTLRIFKEEEEEKDVMTQRLYSQNDGLLRDDELFRDDLFKDGLLKIASASKAATTDLESPFPFYQTSGPYQTSKRRDLYPIRIETSQFPKETFGE